LASSEPPSSKISPQTHLETNSKDSLGQCCLTFDGLRSILIIKKWLARFLPNQGLVLTTKILRKILWIHGRFLYCQNC
jgi:hypothetical protein